MGSILVSLGLFLLSVSFRLFFWFVPIPISVSASVVLGWVSKRTPCVYCTVHLLLIRHVLCSVYERIGQEESLDWGRLEGWKWRERGRGEGERGKGSGLGGWDCGDL